MFFVFMDHGNLFITWCNSLRSVFMGIANYATTQHPRGAKMSKKDFPKKIWAGDLNWYQNPPGYFDRHEVWGEYIRADIHEMKLAEIAKLKAALIEVRDSARSCVPMDVMSTPEQMAMKLTKFARIVNEALEATND